MLNEPFIGQLAFVRGEAFTLTAFERWARWQGHCRDCRAEFSVVAPAHITPRRPFVRCASCRHARRARGERLKHERVREFVEVRVAKRQRIAKPRQPSVKARHTAEMHERLERQRRKTTLYPSPRNAKARRPL